MNTALSGMEIALVAEEVEEVVEHTFSEQASLKTQVTSFSLFPYYL